jgi:CheY-like chemotaxis protein
MAEPGSHAPAPRLLVVEDHDDLLEALCLILREKGFEIATAVDGAEALELLRRADPYDAVVMDDELPRRLGLQLLSILQSEGQQVPVVLHCGSLHLTPEECSRLRVGPVVPKPCDSRRLVQAIQEAIRKRW